MNNQDQVPTIAELWGEFQRLHARFLRLYAGTMPGNVHPDAYMRGKDDLKHKVQSLRQQLLNLCEPWITWRQDGSIYARITFVPSNPDTATLRKCAAICEFAAWEIDQRKLERQSKDD